MSLKQYTLEEVKAHNEEKDLWVIIRDKIYDLTKFQFEHPGGEEVLIEAGGKDATKDFDEVGHSSSAIEMLDQYLIGEIVESERKHNKTEKQVAKKKGDKSNPPQCCVVGVSAVAIALGAALIYAGYRINRNT